MMKQPKSLVEDFQTYFTVDLATSEAQRRDAFRIRYRVYCEEFGYEPAEAFPDALESDDFDVNSVHCLVSHRASGLPAGTVRLVCVDDASQMPMEKFCASAIDDAFVENLDLPRGRLCEFSRLAVDGAFRRRAGESTTRFGEVASLDLSKREQRTFSLIAVSTFISAFAAADLIGRPGCFAMMEPFLPRMLRRSGIRVLPAGDATDYHGIRAPYFILTDSAREGMLPELRDLYQNIHDKFHTQVEQLDAPRLDCTSHRQRGQPERHTLAAAR